MIWFRQVLATCLVLSLGCLGAGCSIRPVSSTDADPEHLDAVWNQFQTIFLQTCPPLDFFARGSVNFSSGERSSRLLFSFWGRTTFPVRMDLQAGVGAMVAHWREDAQGWTGFHPGSEEAFASSDSRAGAAMLGLAMPLRLDSLAHVLIGCWAEVLPQNYISAHAGHDHLEYLVKGRSNDMVVALGFDGRPKGLQGKAPQGWSISIEDWFADQPLSPRRLRLSQGGNVALIRIQRLDYSPVMWQDADLELTLPPGTEIRFLKLLEVNS